MDIKFSSWETYNVAMEEQDHHEHENYSCWPYLPHGHGHGGASTSPHHLGLDQQGAAASDDDEELGAMKEMMFKIAAMQPVDVDPATVRKPRRRNVRISEDPQSVAARHRRERISEKIRILQRLVPGGTKMDTASMLDEAIRYVKFLKRQIRILQTGGGGIPTTAAPTTSYLFGAGSSLQDGGGAGDDHHHHLCFN